MGEGTAVGPEGRRWWKDSDRGTKIPPRRACERGSITLETFCAAGSPPHAGGSFFLYEKSVLRESDSLRGRRTEVFTDLTPPLFRPSKALKKDGIPKGLVHDAPLAAHLRIRRSRIPRCVVKRRTAERESRALAALPDHASVPSIVYIIMISGGYTHDC